MFCEWGVPDGYYFWDKVLFPIAAILVIGDKNKALIVGDSLVSDMPLGIQNGVDTCFFNPKGIRTDLPITYEIKSLPELLNILK